MPRDAVEKPPIVHWSGPEGCLGNRPSATGRVVRRREQFDAAEHKCRFCQTKLAKADRDRERERLKLCLKPSCDQPRADLGDGYLARHCRQHLDESRQRSLEGLRRKAGAA